MSFYEECYWCGKKSSSFEDSSETLFCSTKCKDYYSFYQHIMNIIQLKNIDGFEMKIDQEWHTLFHFLFESNLCLYDHRRDDIGFELGWLYQIYLLNLNNNFNSIKSSSALEHLSNLLYFLRNLTA